MAPWVGDGVWRLDAVEVLADDRLRWKIEQKGEAIVDGLDDMRPLRRYKGPSIPRFLIHG